MANFTLTINGENHALKNLPEDIPLLWVLRDELNLLGTKFGCGGGYCGACTVHLDGVAIRACSIPAVVLEGKSITTIEGLAVEGNLHPLQQAWIEHDVPQCGYCQAGQLMSAAALLKTNPHPSDDAVNQAMEGNLCRCGSYPRIKRAINQVADSLAYDASTSAQGENV